MTAKTPVDSLRSGEDPGSRYPGDARHWAGVYSELLRLIDDAVVELDANRLLSRTDLKGYRSLFEERLSFWEGRLREQEAPSLQRRTRDRMRKRPPERP